MNAHRHTNTQRHTTQLDSGVSRGGRAGPPQGAIRRGGKNGDDKGASSTSRLFGVAKLQSAPP